MGSKQTMFFAIEDDLYPILELIEEEFDIKYVLMGSFESNDLQKYLTFRAIPKLGQTDFGGWLGLDQGYMIISKDYSIKVREVEQRKGGVRYLIDSLKNPDSFELSTGGIYTKKERVIIAGRTAIISEYTFANAVYRLLSSKIKKKFKRIGGYYVGPKAEEKLKAGWRLVQNEGSPREYDLVNTDNK